MRKRKVGADKPLAAAVYRLAGCVGRTSAEGVGSIRTAAGDIVFGICRKNRAVRAGSGIGGCTADRRHGRIDHCIGFDIVIAPAGCVGGERVS